MSIILLTLLSWASSNSVWKGAYTEAQASRGADAYRLACSGCHQPNLSGYGSVLVGAKFMDHWREDNVGNFFQIVKQTMPRGAPASLSDRDYLAITAYVLQFNGFPAGKTELTIESIKRIQIEGENGPAPVPEFALVKTVGCLVEESTGQWKVEHASAPQRTREPHDSPPEELKAAATMKGDDSVSFLKLADYDVDRFKMQGQKGHKVEAKGFLILKDGAKILNLTSIEGVSGTCQ